MSTDMFPDSFIDHVIAHHEKENNMSDSQEKCRVDGKPVETQIYRGTGLCGDDCRKIDAGEVDAPQAQTDAGITNMISQTTGASKPSVDPGTIG